MAKKRLDVLLVERGLMESRQKAQALNQFQNPVLLIQPFQHSIFLNHADKPRTGRQHFACLNQSKHSPDYYKCLNHSGAKPEYHICDIHPGQLRNQIQVFAYQQQNHLDNCHRYCKGNQRNHGFRSRLCELLINSLGFQGSNNRFFGSASCFFQD